MTLCRRRENHQLSNRAVVHPFLRTFARAGVWTKANCIRHLPVKQGRRDRVSMSTFRHLAKRVLGSKLLGVADYYRFPQQRRDWGGPFNGQEFRRGLFDRMWKAVGGEYIVETGTFHGTTTEYFASTGARVHSIDTDPRAYGFARARLWRERNVHLHLGDSVEVLRALLQDSWFRSRTGLYYLDAHWGERLPLAEEVDAIAVSCPLAIMMIDDFRVPDDAGYGFDDYGPGRRVELELLERLILARQLAVFFPAEKAELETGAKRGCVVLTQDPRHIETLGRLRHLRRWS